MSTAFPQMDWVNALRLEASSKVALVGAGGKSTAMFSIARDWIRVRHQPIFLTTTTHLGDWQTAWADQHIVVDTAAQLDALCKAKFPPQVILFTGPPQMDRRLPAPSNLQFSTFNFQPLLIEADGAQGKALKTPAAHEPALPAFVDAVIVVASLEAVGKPLDASWVHRLEEFRALSGLSIGQIITLPALAAVLNHPHGGLKNIPHRSRKLALLTHAESPAARAQSCRLSKWLLSEYQSVITCQLKNKLEKEISGGLGDVNPLTVHDRIAGVLLAAGGSRRMDGKAKQLLLWQGKPLVRHIAEIGLQAGLSPLIVVVGAQAGLVAAALSGLDVQIVENSNWQAGQSSSVRLGVQSLPPEVGAAFFLLSDQPFLTPELLWSLKERHAATHAVVIAPLADGRRANPVLFDRRAFEQLAALQGDTGGRAVFSKFKVDYLSWHDARICLDIDTPQDYRRLAS